MRTCVVSVMWTDRYPNTNATYPGCVAVVGPVGQLVIQEEYAEAGQVFPEQTYTRRRDRIIYAPGTWRQVHYEDTP